MKNATDIVERRLRVVVGNTICESVHHHLFYTLGENTFGNIHRVLEWQVWEDTDQIEHREGDTLKDRAPGQVEAFLRELPAYFLGFPAGGCAVNARGECLESLSPNAKTMFEFLQT